MFPWTVTSTFKSAVLLAWLTRTIAVKLPQFFPDSARIDKHGTLPQLGAPDAGGEGGGEGAGGGEGGGGTGGEGLGVGAGKGDRRVPEIVAECNVPE